MEIGVTNILTHINVSKILIYFTYFIISIFLFSSFFKTYIYITPHNEIDLIKKGNVAVSLVLSGTLLGYAANLAFAIFYSYGIIQFIIYGIFSAILQIFCYFLLQKFFNNLQEEIRENNNVAVGLLFGSISLCVGVLNGASAY